MAARSRGYTGVSQAVAPVPWLNGLLKPLPKTSDRAMFPVSCWNGTMPRRFAGTWRPSCHANAARAPRATSTISGSEISSLRQVGISRYVAGFVAGWDWLCAASAARPAPSLARSSGVMPVSLPSGMLFDFTACSSISAACALISSIVSNMMPLGAVGMPACSGVSLWQGLQCVRMMRRTSARETDFPVTGSRGKTARGGEHHQDITRDARACIAIVDPALILEVEEFADRPRCGAEAAQDQPVVGDAVEHRIMVADHDQQDRQRHVIVVHGALLGDLAEARIGLLALEQRGHGLFLIRDDDGEHIGGHGSADHRADVDESAAPAEDMAQLIRRGDQHAPQATPKHATVAAEWRLAEQVVDDPAAGNKAQADKHCLPRYKLRFGSVDEVELRVVVVDHAEQKKPLMKVR